MKMRALIAEFIGTFTLIFIGVGAITANHITNGASGLVGIALAHGLAIAVMVSATAAFSGGHLNPAVSFGAFVGRKLDLSQMIGYMIAQCLGAIAGAAMIYCAVPHDAIMAVGMGTPVPGAGVEMWQVLLMEIVLTFFLVFVVFGTGIDKRGPKVGGLFIGLTVALDILVGGPISGAAMNPARHLGPALFSGAYANMLLYWAAPLIGGGLAGLVYANFFDEK